MTPFEERQRQALKSRVCISPPLSLSTQSLLGYFYCSTNNNRHLYLPTTQILETFSYRIFECSFPKPYILLLLSILYAHKYLPGILSHSSFNHRKHCKTSFKALFLLLNTKQTKNNSMMAMNESGFSFSTFFS